MSVAGALVSGSRTIVPESTERPDMTVERLGAKQRRFARMVQDLLAHIHSIAGYEVTFGDAYRDPRVHGAVGTKLGYGHPKSAHKQRLAIDLNLFIDGVFQTTTEAHRPIGEWWEKQAPDARWGGRFNDGNHYSLEHDGIK
jgi:hypothetical protein